MNNKEKELIGDENNDQDLNETPFEDNESNIEDKVKTETEENIEAKSDDYKTKYEEINDRYLRLYSEFDNYRRRTAREKIDLINSASSEMLKVLIPVLDDFDRAVISNETLEDIGIMREGINLVHHKFKKTLTDKGLKEMEMTSTFDVEKHEAITSIPAPSEELKGKIIEVIEKGYTLNDKVIRFAKVILGN